MERIGWRQSAPRQPRPARHPHRAPARSDRGSGSVRTVITGAGREDDTGDKLQSNSARSPAALWRAARGRSRPAGATNPRDNPSAVTPAARCLVRLRPEIAWVVGRAADFKRNQVVFFVIAEARIAVPVFPNLLVFQAFRIVLRRPDCARPSPTQIVVSIFACVTFGSIAPGVRVGVGSGDCAAAIPAAVR